MKRALVTVFFVFGLFISVIAQQQRRPVERIHAAKMAYITDRLHLTVDQSGHFIPLYNEYELEIRETRKSFMQKYKGMNPDEVDDTTSRHYIDDNLDYQEKAIAIKRKYKDRFLAIISPQQVADLYVAEREFRQMLMHQMDKRRNNMGGRGGDWGREDRRGRD